MNSGLLEENLVLLYANLPLLSVMEKLKKRANSRGQLGLRPVLYLSFLEICPVVLSFDQPNTNKQPDMGEKRWRQLCPFGREAGLHDQLD